VASDVLDDCRDLLTGANVPEGTVSRIVGELRHRWGGSQCYIRATDRAERDATIRRALESGADAHQAARAAGVSPSTVRRRRAQWLG